MNVTIYNCQMKFDSKSTAPHNINNKHAYHSPASLEENKEVCLRSNEFWYKIIFKNI